MVILTCYSIFLNESLRKQQKMLPSCRDIKSEVICGAISAEVFFVSWYRHRFRVLRLKYLSRWCLDICRFTDEGLGIYPIWKICVFFLPTLDRLASILRPK